jgi:predicted DNA-binding transcriptional regulator AlpA
MIIIRAALPETGFVRLRLILDLIPVSKSTWWQGVKTGRFPKPVKLGPRMTAWKVDDIRSLIQKTEQAAGPLNG